LPRSPVTHAFVPGQTGKLGYQGVFGLEPAPAMNEETLLEQTLAYLSKGTQPVTFFVLSPYNYLESECRI
jgi:hypothetical protein